MVLGLESVKDWESRIAGYTEPQKEFYRRMVPLLDEAKKLNAEREGWRFLTDDARKKIQIETRKSARNLNMVRATGPIDFPPLTVFQAIEYGAGKAEWDDTHADCYFVKKLGVNAHVMYNRMIRVLFVEGRDFVVDSLMQQEDDGTIIHVI